MRKAALTASCVVRVQWHVNQEDGDWILRNVAKGLYLGVEGIAANGTPVVGVAKRFRWDIRPDENDSSTFRCVAATSTNIRDLRDGGSVADHL